MLLAAPGMQVAGDDIVDEPTVTVDIGAPGDVIGKGPRMLLHGRAEHLRAAGAGDSRELFLLVAGIEVRPVSEDRAEAKTLPLITDPSPERLLDRFRHTERRPPVRTLMPSPPI